MSEHILLDYSIHFTAPFHLGTGLRRGLVHRSVARDASGYLYVPGSTLKGVLRERCEQFCNLFGLRSREPHVEAASLDELTQQPILVDEIFGSRSRPGTLYFDDACLDAEGRALFDPAEKTDLARYRESQVEPRTRVAMSRRTGSAMPHHLFSSEYGLAQLSFEGRISGILNSPALPEPATCTYGLVMLVAVLLSVESLGSDRSCGAGACTVELRHVRVNRTPREIPPILDGLEYLEYYDYRD